MRLIIYLSLSFGLLAQSPSTAQPEEPRFRSYEDAHKEFSALIQKAEALNCNIDDIACLNTALELRGDIDQLARNPAHIKGDCFGGYGFTHEGSCKPMMLLADQANTVFLDRLLSHHGFPTGEEWTKGATLSAFLIIQHGDPYDEGGENNTKRRETYLPAIKEAVLKGQLVPFGYVAMFDRVQLHREGRQTYATQFNCDGSKALFKGIPNETEINNARLEIGFQPFEETRKMANDRCADRLNRTRE